MHNMKINKKQSIDILDLYLEEINKYPLLKENEEKELLIKIKSGDKKAKENFINSNLRLVVYYAKKYRNKGIQYLDLIEEGNLGLLKAVENFNTEKNCKFSTYATQYIEEYIKNALLTKSRVISIPIRKNKKLYQIKMIKEELSKKLGRKVNLEELAQELNMSLKELKEIYIYLNDTVSLNEKLVSEEEKELLEVIEDKDKGNLEDSIIKKISIEEIYKLLKNILNEKELKIILYRYGFYQNNIFTYKQISDILGISQQAINKMEKKIIKKLEKNQYIKKYYKLI